MSTLEYYFLPLGAFWVAIQTILGSIAFVNNMRETIVTGQYDGVPLTIRHRYAMRFDWTLSMIGLISGLFMFSIVIFWLAYAQANALGGKISVAMLIVGIATFLGGVLFVLCGISDHRLMQFVLRNAASRSHTKATITVIKD